MKPVIPSFIFRHRAWKAIKPILQVLVVVGLLAVLPGYLNQAVVGLTDADPGEYTQYPALNLLEFAMQEVPEDITDEEYAALLEQQEVLIEEYQQSWDTFVQEKGAIYFGMMALMLLLTPILTAPLYGTLLDAQRNKPVTLGLALGKLRYGPKMLLTYLWMALRVWVWTLPGMALLVAGMLSPAVGDVLMIVGGALMLVLGLRAMLHYIMAPIALMDQPRRSPNACIRLSHQVMRTRKMEYFLLRISFALWYLLVSLLAYLQVSVVMVAVSLTLSMMAEMLLTVYVSGAEVAFYEAYAVRGETGYDLEKEFARDGDESADDPA